MKRKSALNPYKQAVTEKWPYYSCFSRIKDMAYTEVLHPIILPDQYFTLAFSNMLIKICSWLYSQFFLKQSEKK